ncbi:MAG: hypothetical protein GF421_08970 [Candidatus Aminicenantes bacterium]|nr:hypothetical protein [Candidatus Aminicenantes bacterium]
MGGDKMGYKDYEQDLRLIRKHLDHMPKPKPPHELFEKTRNLCHRKLSKSPQSPRIPFSIWLALIGSVILTGVLMLPLAKALKSGQPLSSPSIGVLILMIQNAVMLFFAPVLFSKYKEKQNTGNSALST